MPTVRFLCTGDLHVHEYKQFAITRPDGMNSRLYYCLKVFDILLKEAQERGISKILLNGDILSESDYIHTEVYDAVYRKVERMYEAGLEVVVNCGNHDLVFQHGGRVLHSLRPFRQVSTVVEKPTFLWGALHVLPYQRRPEKLKATIRRVRASRSHGLVLHCGVQGAKTGPTAYLVRNPIKLKDVRPTEFGLVLLSDYHTHQWLSENTLYLGSPLQHSFGEIHRPCIWDVRLLGHGTPFEARKIYTNLPRFRSISIHKTEDIEKAVHRYAGDYLRFRLPAGGRVSREMVEKTIGSRLLYVIDEAEDAGHEEDKPGTSALHPVEVIKKYARSKISDSSRAKKLVELGAKLYKLEI